MTRKSDGEKIDELERIASTLVERLDNVRREMIDRERFAVVEERLNEFKRIVEETGRKRWSIWSSFVGGIIGATLTFIAQWAFTYLKK